VKEDERHARFAVVFRHWKKGKGRGSINTPKCYRPEEEWYQKRKVTEDDYVKPKYR